MGFLISFSKISFPEISSTWRTFSQFGGGVHAMYIMLREAEQLLFFFAFFQEEPVTMLKSLQCWNYTDYIYPFLSDFN